MTETRAARLWPAPPDLGQKHARGSGSASLSIGARPSERGCQPSRSCARSPVRYVRPMSIPHPRQPALAKVPTRFANSQLVEGHYDTRRDVVPAAGTRKENPSHG